MKISLLEFEFTLDSVTVKRGGDYYDNKLVENLVKGKSQKWSGWVRGTQDHKVTVLLKGDKIEEFHCSCLSDSGPVCKHVVAILFAIREIQTTKPR